MRRIVLGGSGALLLVEALAAWQWPGNTGVALAAALAVALGTVGLLIVAGVMRRPAEDD